MLQTLGRILGKCSIIPGGLIILASTVSQLTISQKFTTIMKQFENVTCLFFVISESNWLMIYQ